MNTLDIVLLAIACILVVIGMAKGLIRIVIGVAAILAAFALAARFHRPLADLLSGAEIPTGVMHLVSYAGIFLGTMIAGTLLAWLLRKVVSIAMLGWADRLAGGALGFLGALAIAAMLILPIIAYIPSGSTILTKSTLAPYVTVVSDVATSVAPDELTQAYQQKIDELRRRWRNQVEDGSV